MGNKTAISNIKPLKAKLKKKFLTATAKKNPAPKSSKTP